MRCDKRPRVDASQRTVLRHIVNRPLVDKMLRDRLVAGIRDKPLSDKLQMKADLTLESAKKDYKADLRPVHNMTQGLALRCVKVVTSENIELPAKFLRSDA